MVRGQVFFFDVARTLKYRVEIEKKIPKGSFES